MGPSSGQVHGGTPPRICSQRRSAEEYRSVTRLLASGTSMKRAPRAARRKLERKRLACGARSRPTLMRGRISQSSFNAASSAASA